MVLTGEIFVMWEISYMPHKRPLSWVKHGNLPLCLSGEIICPHARNLSLSLISIKNLLHAGHFIPALHGRAG